MRVPQRLEAFDVLVNMGINACQDLQLWAHFIHGSVEPSDLTRVLPLFEGQYYNDLEHCFGSNMRALQRRHAAGRLRDSVIWAVGWNIGCRHRQSAPRSALICSCQRLLRSSKATRFQGWMLPSFALLRVPK